ncbi:uncharacterized protein LOC123014518 [Tribolium madens]|uniref:uncharacterized protein LOC123014518 n=1 Tax=Tribolium madens TaxID=41895 RepID=UPI001CF73BB5|nr:uncharacterized protein LOC123014518 [Tribolium madens]
MFGMEKKSDKCEAVSNVCANNVLQTKKKRRSSLFGNYNINNKQNSNYRNWLLNEIEEYVKQQKQLQETVSNNKLQATEKCDIASILKKKDLTLTDVDNYTDTATSFINKHVIFMERQKYMTQKIKELGAKFIK